MSETVLGSILNDTHVIRDAIHIAVAPVIAGEILKPGTHIGFVDKKNNVVGGVRKGVKAIGIVDPFLRDDVNTGQLFYICLYPRTITSLRHLWFHPEFEEDDVLTIDKQKAAKSRLWLTDFCEKYNINYQELISEIINEREVCFGDDDGPDAARDPEFWEHLENVTGRRFNSDFRENTYFRCAC